MEEDHEGDEQERAHQHDRGADLEARGIVSVETEDAGGAGRAAARRRTATRRRSLRDSTRSTGAPGK